jgi:hypothetical protein
VGLLKDKYKSLAPQAHYLCDVVVLAQAWKKSHSYIRRHNWYADTLELDCSAVDLDNKLAEWAEALSGGCYESEPAWLVPAPKNAPWVFNKELSGGWGPKVDPGGKPPALRPLAHLGIREQTVTTALMLCLADCIETAQGNPSLPPEQAAKQGVYSYGNRLFCKWSAYGSRARFSWGNSDTYSRYFQDYQQFVERPNAIAQLVDTQKSADEHVYIVKLDLSAFYDNVDVARLVSCLEREYADFCRMGESLQPADEGFWSLAQQVLCFTWRDEDKKLAHLFRGGVLPDGLPQGLIASGFLANAYLLDFDRLIGGAARAKTVIDDVIRLHDYCRYVDDLRLVISVRAADFSEALVARTISDWVQAQLDKATVMDGGNDARLSINGEKTELELYSAVGGESGTAARMKSLQHQLSGPFDVAALLQVETALNGLLALAELGLREEQASASSGSLPILASVARPKLEVRDDTLTRFSAYRLTKSLRMRRSMTDMSEQVEGEAAREALLHDYEVVARRLVAAWAINPSLVQVLRYALDLFPDPDLLNAVTDALKAKLQAVSRSSMEGRVVLYVFAELFKAGATETGRRAAQDPCFKVGDVEQYRANLAGIAKAMLSEDVPWYVKQQASLFLASAGRPIVLLGGGRELHHHRVLHEFLLGKSKSRKTPVSDEVSISLVGYQLNENREAYVAWFKQFSVGREKGQIREALQLIGQTDLALFTAITQGWQGRISDENESIPNYLGAYTDSRWPDNPPDLPINTWLPLAKAITHPAAVFDQENALLQLALALSSLKQKQLKNPELLTPLTIEVCCSDWVKLRNPNVEVLKVRHVIGDDRRDPVYSTPSWCATEHAWMYAIGRLLRAAATGELDFTARQWLLSSEAGWYNGIRSTWQKRRMGMIQTATAIGGTTSAVTPWFSNLLLSLLRWPGIAAEEVFAEFESVATPKDLASLVRKRVEQQAELFGSSSNIPVYRYPVEWPMKSSRHLRVVLVQGLMPATKDFEGGILGLSAPGYRERHRNHTAALLHLAYRQLQAVDSVLGQDHKPQVDLVVFPELTIHADDQDFMRAFSDATGAMLFYGLLGASVPGTGYPANMARWLVPQWRGGRRSWIEVDQGKWHLTYEEKKLGIIPWRPYQVVIELQDEEEPGFRLSGAVCYDATDIALAADLKDESHMFVVVAMNKDVKTFDNMVSALRYHMYQHVLIANSGEYGGSTAQAPYDLEHKRLISHVHGSQQIAVSVFDVNVDDFGPLLNAAQPGSAVKKSLKERIGKTPPAGLQRWKSK